jgi:hypothetical protein
MVAFEHSSGYHHLVGPTDQVGMQPLRDAQVVLGVQLPSRFQLSSGSELIQGIGPNGLQHCNPRLTSVVLCDGGQTVIDELGNEVERVGVEQISADSSDGIDVRPSGEYAEAVEERLLSCIEQVMRPGDGVAQSFLPRRSLPAVAERSSAVSSLLSRAAGLNSLVRAAAS